MWFGEKLWSDGYGFFAFFDIFSGSDDENSATFAISEIITPRRFVVSSGDKRNIVSSSDSGYSRLVSETVSLFKNIDNSFVLSSRDQWLLNLK